MAKWANNPNADQHVFLLLYYNIAYIFYIVRNLRVKVVWPPASWQIRIVEWVGALASLTTIIGMSDSVFLFTWLFQQAFNEPDVYETGDLPEDDQAQFESVSRRFVFTRFVRLQKLV